MAQQYGPETTAVNLRRIIAELITNRFVFNPRAPLPDWQRGSLLAGVLHNLLSYFVTKPLQSVNAAVDWSPVIQAFVLNVAEERRKVVAASMTWAFPSVASQCRCCLMC
jgi:hypothetical protein